MKQNDEKEQYFVTVEEVYQKIKELRKSKEEIKENEIEQQTEQEIEQIDDILLFASERSIEMVKGYCNIEKVPKELKNVCVEITMLLYDNENYREEEKNARLKSITEGNVSVSYQSEKSSWREQKNVLLRTFSEELDKFRNMKW
ncbi:hypothetical protein [Clostridium sp. MD294]|uniref:hypothetical protein n=1 Tax=Clostridium sp. MD294 TaxID=97138 RepID=UPI0002CA3927|nr:hypothetical protein [Clostridium sp. MD294]NDO46208.1 hypothetical protein [Clostridium sp. MD294]USF30124.1 hypothetical protein C820_001565 [Clostridium sp. MD294]